jgi:5'-AMP-activated protein kinase catalytic alpha subunit
MNELKILDDYILCRTIGKGTFSKVKLGVHRTTREKVAIKIIDKKQVNNKKDSERIHREIKILKSINHNNIVKIKSVRSN